MSATAAFRGRKMRAASLPSVARRLRSSSNNDRLGRTLYRQLIRWCRNTDRAIPLSSFVPPVTLKPPHVEQESLQKFASKDDDWTRVSQLLPSNSKVEPHQMIVPIANAEDAANLFRVVFRMNNVEDTSQEVFKQRISTAFEALKSLNQLTGGLESLKEQREKHLDRTGVLYRVGQGRITWYVCFVFIRKALLTFASTSCPAQEGAMERCHFRMATS